MSRFLNGIKSFVHSISTADHYAAYDPARPQGVEDAAPLATAAADRRSSSSSASTAAGVPGYSAGMRSQQMGASGAGGIPLSDLNRDGPPIPSPALSWNRIDAWIEQNYPELYDQVLGGATANDLNDLEHDLDCVLPADVRESFEVHDGQEKGGRPTGIFYGVTLLDLEGISEEWNVWRQTAIRLEEMQQRRKQQTARASSSTAPQQQHQHAGAMSWVDNQASCPPEHVQPVYAHPGWIPLAKDFDGNNIAVDLAPGPKGRFGQVILFGRDFDVKYAVAPSWGDFLAQFAADLESGSCFIDEDLDNAVFAFKAPDGRLVSYFNVLRQRVERTLPPKQATPRRSAMSASVSAAPVNSGRATPRLVSPTGSSTSLPRVGHEATIKLEPGAKTVSSTKLNESLNEVDLSDDVAKAGTEPSKGTKAASTNAAAPNVTTQAADTKATEAKATEKATEKATTEAKATESKATSTKPADTNAIEEAADAKAADADIVDADTADAKAAAPKGASKKKKGSKKEKRKLDAATSAKEDSEEGSDAGQEQSKEESKPNGAADKAS